VTEGKGGDEAKAGVARCAPRQRVRGRHRPRGGEADRLRADSLHANRVACEVESASSASPALTSRTTLSLWRARRLG